MDVVPGDVDSETHRQNFRDRAASLGSIPQASTPNLRSSRGLRLRSSIASMKGITCVHSIAFSDHN